MSEQRAARDALHAEWTKLRTSPGTSWLLLGIIAATVGVGGAATAGTTCLGCAVDQTRLGLTGVQLGQAVVAILGVWTIGVEYATGLVRVSLVAMPRRHVVLAAKAAVLTGVVILTGAVAVAASLVVGWLIAGPPTLSLVDGPVLRAAAGSILYLALIGLLSLGVASAVRNSVAAVGIVLGLLYVFPIIARASSDPDWQRHLEQIGPMTAGLAIQATTDLDRLPIKPWAGLGVLGLWALAALLVGGFVFLRRDA